MRLGRVGFVCQLPQLLLTTVFLLSTVTSNANGSDCPYDPLEPNDDCFSTALIEVGREYELVICDHYDYDFLRFQGDSSKLYHITIELLGDGGAGVYGFLSSSYCRSTFGNIIAFRDTATRAGTIETGESEYVIELSSFGIYPEPPTLYRIKVEEYLCASDQFEPNDACNAATLLKPGTYRNLTYCGNEDWYRIEGAPDQQIIVMVNLCPEYGLADVSFYADCQASYIGSENRGEYYRYGHKAYGGERYYLRIGYIPYPRWYSFAYHGDYEVQVEQKPVLGARTFLRVRHVRYDSSASQSLSVAFRGYSINRPGSKQFYVLCEVAGRFYYLPGFRNSPVVFHSSPGGLSHDSGWLEVFDEFLEMMGQSLPVNFYGGILDTRTGNIVGNIASESVVLE